MFTRRGFIAGTTGFAAFAGTGAGAFASGRIKVATTFTIIADMAQNVAGDLADVVSITKPGSEIHGYQPTPRDILAAQDADLILWNGMNLELWFEQFFRNLRNVPAAVLSDGVDPMPISSGSYEGKPNPHAWMALDSALIYVDNIRDALIRDGHTLAQNIAAVDVHVLGHRLIQAVIGGHFDRRRRFRSKRRSSPSGKHNQLRATSDLTGD